MRRFALRRSATVAKTRHPGQAVLEVAYLQQLLRFGRVLIVLEGTWRHEALLLPAKIGADLAQTED
jgi:hypothetical protein